MIINNYPDCNAVIEHSEPYITGSKLTTCYGKLLPFEKQRKHEFNAGNYHTKDTNSCTIWICSHCGRTIKEKDI